MVKKFSFDFKFLERFKKKAPESELPPEEISDEVDEITEEDEEIDPAQFQEMPANPARKKREFTSLDDLNNDTEYGNVEASEEFAEKTLSNFKVPQLNPEVEELLRQSAVERRNNPEAFEDNDDEIEINYQEMQPPTQPEEAKKFNFNFSRFSAPKFGDLRNKNFKPNFNKFSKMGWNDIVLKIFSPYSRGRIHNTFLVLLVIALTYLFGKTIALFTNRQTVVEIKPKTNIIIPAIATDSSVTDINKITSANLFNAKESEEVKAKGPKVDISQIHCVAADRPTSKQIKLLDTIVLQDSVKSVASVQMRGGNDLMNVREGEQIDGAEISKIQRMKLILKDLETGDCEYLSSEKEDDIPIACSD